PIEKERQQNSCQSLCSSPEQTQLHRGLQKKKTLQNLIKSLVLLVSVQIDDKEFDIPQVDTPPTLESILSQEGEEAFILEDTMNTDNMDAHSYDTSSLASSDSGDPAHPKRRKRAQDARVAASGSVLRLSLLKGISAQIVAAADKVDAGLPTATMNSVIAVGTSHGLAFVFDTSQALRLCLGSKATGAEFGAVSALSINHNCSRLLCGFAKGQITMWDLANGKLLRTITDAHPPGTAILHIKVTSHGLLVCHGFRRLMGMRSCDSRCLFSGSKGEVCCIEPLRSPPDYREHPITQYSLLAMASLTKILVIGLKPTLNVWMTFPYSKSDPSSVPQLAWHFVSVQKMVNPILAFCKGDTVHFLLVKKEEMGTIHVIKQRQLHLSCDIISLNWINSRTLVLVDSQEKLHVVDRPTQEVLETLDLEQVQLVYNSRHFKSLATGGNVSQALVGEKACYQSVSSYAGQILCLGTKSAHIMALRNWNECIDLMLKQEHFVEALSLAWSFHEGTAKAMVGLHGDAAKRKAVVSDKMVELLLQFAEHALKKHPEQGKSQTGEQNFQVFVCRDLLFDELYPRVAASSLAKAVFLESLESYIVSSRLDHLPTPVIKDLLSHYHNNGMMDSLERCIVHLDVTSLDIQQVVQVCWTNRLYDAVIYIYNRGMNDFITPMEKLFTAIGPAVKGGRSLTDEDVVMGNKLLVYISCCLAGRAYPLGDIPADLVVQVKNQVFDFLIRLHSNDSSEEEDVFPFIRTLLHFDTREFLNVLSMTFEDFKNDKQALEYQQRIVDILLQVMVDNQDFTPSQVGGLFTFLARQLVKPDNTLFVNRKLFDQVRRPRSHLCVLLDLLQVEGVVQFNEDRLLVLAEKAQFYQICEFLFEKKHLYDRIIDCYLKDPVRQCEIFSYIHNLLSMPGYSCEEKQTVRSKVLQHVQELVILDPTKSADLVSCHFSDCVNAIISELQDPPLLFSFLRCLLEPREGPGPTLCPDQDLHELLLGLMCQFDPQQLLTFLHTSQHYRLEEAILITEKHGCLEARAYLLEKKGDVHGAFAGLLQVKHLNGEKHLKESLDVIIAFSHRNCPSLDQEQRKTLWFPILDALMASQKETLNSGSSLHHLTLPGLKEMTLKVLNHMSSFISLPAIIQQILQDPVYGRGKLSEIQGLILGMLDTFNYEQTLLETTTSLLNHDLHWSLAHLRAAVTRGLHPLQEHCNICLQHYKRRPDSREEVVVFSCGHLYHRSCLQQKDLASEQWRCCKCSSSHMLKRGPAGRPSRSRSTSLAQVDFSLHSFVLQLSIIAEPSHGDATEKTVLQPPGQESSESFFLKLAPPPLFEE
uniref:VPS8 subunit of CORVET complex n=1 Tax=Oryzias latipes TaxID=8090 RepID=H2MIR9_ORYLA